MGKMTNEQKNRFAIAEKVITRDALASGLTLEDLISVADYVERGAVWRKPDKKKRRKGGARGPVRKTTADPRAWWAPAGEPLPNPWKPLGYLTEDGLKEDPAFSVADVFRRDARPDLAVPGPPTVAGATLEKFAEKVRDGDLAAEPAPVKAADGIDLRGIRTRWDAERNVQRGVYPAMPGVRHEDAEESVLDEGKAAGCPECAEELERRVLEVLDTPDPDATSSQPVGEDPGDRRVLTQWAEAICQQEAAREAAREARDLEVEFEDGKDPEVVKLTPFSTPEEKARAEAKEPETCENAPDHVVAEGASLGCPECSAELERREKRDEALERGRIKLGNRLPAGEFARTGPLDEDELLAVAGSEVYPPNDEEPSRERRIRNRKGEVRAWKSGGAQDGYGWTSTPEDPWGLRYAWTSLEMSRRGPWHVV